jgi:hypothetical protein
VTVDRRLGLWHLVVDQARGSPATVADVGKVAIAITGVDAVAIAVTLAASPRETVYTSDRAAADMEELTMTLGQGPGIDALSGGPAFAVDLRGAHCESRWPVFAPAAAQLGVQAVFAFPLQVGGIRVGVVDLYRGTPGSLDPKQLTDALLLADMACALLLDATTVAHDGRRPEDASLQHAEVHQATGMLIAQIGVTAAVALIRLRAYAYSHDRRLRDVASDVVARRLRFEHDPETKADAADHDEA